MAGKVPVAGQSQEEMCADTSVTEVSIKIMNMFVLSYNVHVS